MLLFQGTYFPFHQEMKFPGFICSAPISKTTGHISVRGSYVLKNDFLWKRIKSNYPSIYFASYASVFENICYMETMTQVM